MEYIKRGVGVLGVGVVCDKELHLEDVKTSDTLG
jgi:hypothetical protein